VKIKEAIEFLDNLKDEITFIDIDEGNEKAIEEYNNELDKVISLLKRGEKYRQMWEEFGDLYCFNCVDLNENKNGILETRPTKYKTIHTLMLIIEQKYLKEAKNDKS